jgi:phosphohistidine phosphatase
VTLYLVHHGEAVSSDVDPQRPLSAAGRAGVTRLATEAARRGARPRRIWHSGKLRARQTAEAFWRALNPLADLSATRDLQPDDPPEWIRDRLRGETDDVLIAGHFPHLPRLLSLLLAAPAADFPLHGVVALTRGDEGKTWNEAWRLERGS